MKKWPFALGLLLMGGVAGSYIFIGSTLTVSKISAFRTNITGASRVLSKQDTWKKWWPGTAKNDGNFSYNNSAYQVTHENGSKFSILIINDQDTINSRLELLSLRNDSIVIDWKCTFPTGSNPVSRWQHYRAAVMTKKNMNAIVSRLRDFLEKKENIYQFDIRKVNVVDSNLVSTKAIFPAYPDLHEIYGLVKTLQDYATLQKARQSGHPMMHVTKKDSSHYELMVAIPTDKALPDNERISYKHMVPGPILVTEVQGGRRVIDQAYVELENFKTDYNITSPAIPFESMVTDRTKEPDSSKWITKVYYPVIPF